MSPAEVPARYENAAGLRQLLLCGESDAWLALGLAMQLSGMMAGVCRILFKLGWVGPNTHLWKVCCGAVILSSSSSSSPVCTCCA